MGACCSETISKHQSTNKEPLTLATPRPVTLDQVNKSIDEWKQIAKRRKPNVTVRNEEKYVNEEMDLKNYIQELGVDEGLKKKELNTNFHEEIDKSSNSFREINEDFLNINKKINRGFDDISSTIHFTVLNSKDLASSKMKFNYNNHHCHSQSIVNVLDELNNLNKESALNNCNQIPFKIIPNRKIIENSNFKPKNKIYIQNNAYIPNMKSIFSLII
jgi:hypothetical protein